MSPSTPQRPRLTILGTGYLGATHAVSMAELGYEVLGVDVDEAKITKLAGGQVPFHEPELDELLRKNLASGRLRFTTSYAEAAEFGDVHFICVGTPQKNGSKAADMSYVESAVSALAPHLTHKSLVVGKSTVPVGTAEWVEQLLHKYVPADTEVEVAWNPEFLREGFAVEDTLRPDRLVFGVKTDWAKDMLDRAYKGVFELAQAEDREVPVVVTDFATAELVKVSANSFLATKISFINAMAEVCDAAGADVTQLARAIGYDVRIGNKFLRAGIGFGGGCLPKDIRAFQARAEELGVGSALHFLAEVDIINQRRRTHVVELTTELVGGDVTGVKVAALGAAFKPNSDDVRDAPQLAIARQPARGRRHRERVRPGGCRQRPPRAARPELRRLDGGGGPRRRHRAGADRVGRVPAREPGRARRAGQAPAGHRRPQLPRPDQLARRRLELPRPRPPVSYRLPRGPAANGGASSGLRPTGPGY